MLAYQKALLDYGMLILNFWNAIAKGDRKRIFRCWKYFLIDLKHQGRSSTKYALISYVSGAHSFEPTSCTPPSLESLS